MFVPFGIIFPLLHSRFQKAVWTIGSGLLFTLSIELFQLITGLGIFEVDDLFNNLLGAILGYGIVMGILKIREKKFKRAVAYFSPLFLVLILFGGMFAYYHLKEFGNLSLAASKKVDMNETTVILDVVLDDMDSTVPIYKVNSYSHTEAKEFVEAFFKNIDIGTEELEEDLYLDTGFYTTRVDPTFRVSFEFFDGRYDYLDFSSLDGIDLKDTDEKNLLNKLTNFGINIPTDSQFQQTETGSYEWTIRNDLENDQLLEGYISVNYYADDSIKNISNQLITYDKVKDVQIKREQEAFNELFDGKFLSYSQKINKIKIHDVELNYHLDSKGFYQPVYDFHSTVDGNETTIQIPAL